LNVTECPAVWTLPADYFRPFAKLFAWQVLAVAGLGCGFMSTVWAAAAPCAVPAAVNDGWAASDPTQAGFDAPEFCALVDSVVRGDANLHSVLVERGGKLVAELYRRGPDRSIWSLFARETDFGPQTRHDLRSISKSVISLLVGIARQQGKLANLAQPVLDFYPEYAELRTPERLAITLEHLLGMSTGLAWNESLASYGSFANDETRLYWDWAPYRYVLSRAIEAAPGTRFNYNGGNTAVLADVLQRVTQTRLKDFARSALFEPLGITDWEWVGDPYGRSLAFAGLRMRPRDLAKLGRLVLNRGQWQGRQLLAPEWVDESLQPRLPTGDGGQYGQQWWTGTTTWQGKPLAWSAAIGNGGQRLFVVPALDLSVVMTAGAYNEREFGGLEMALFKKILATVRP